MKALCFGSLNIDLTYQVPHFLQPGETLASLSLQTFPGGKGLNQAVALARGGLDTWIAGAIGADGRFLMDILEEAGVHTEQLMLLKETRTGEAIIQRTPDGENAILLYSGANHCISEDMLRRALEPFGEGDLLLIQNEINGVPDIIRAAHEKGMTVALNASPVTEELLNLPKGQIDILLVNETEAAQLLSMPAGADMEALLAGMETAYPEAHVVVTAGAAGAWVLRHGHRHFQPAVPVTAVDTTCAGDTFTGFYLGSIMRGETAAEAARRAALAAALCVTRDGASPSIPTQAELAEAEAAG